MQPLIYEAQNARISAKSRETSKLQDVMPDLLRPIPPRDTCDQAVGCYLRTFEQIFRILHIPSFRGEYEEFWNNPNGSPTAFVLKLALVIALGGVFLSDRT